MTLSLFDDEAPPVSRSRLVFLSGILATWLATERRGPGAKATGEERRLAETAAEIALRELASRRPVV